MTPDEQSAPDLEAQEREWALAKAELRRARIDFAVGLLMFAIGVALIIVLVAAGRAR